jgi:hypothetical protein
VQPFVGTARRSAKTKPRWSQSRGLIHASTAATTSRISGERTDLAAGNPCAHRSGTPGAVRCLALAAPVPSPGGTYYPLRRGGPKRAADDGLPAHVDVTDARNGYRGSSPKAIATQRGEAGSLDPQLSRTASPSDAAVCYTADHTDGVAALTSAPTAPSFFLKLSMNSPADRAGHRLGHGPLPKLQRPPRTADPSLPVTLLTVAGRAPDEISWP